MPVPVSPEEKRAAKRRREEEEYERGLEQMVEDIPEIKIDHKRSKKDPDFIYYQATFTAVCILQVNSEADYDFK